jgi:predicted CXXCH cytochrome family protein
VKKLTLLIAAGSLWLFLAAVPVFADGGPHVSSANSGVSTLAADGCAGCHRAHTAQGEMLLTSASEEELCLSCHGAASTGATTDVMTGIQYAIGPNGLRTATQLGALRGGGFDQARLGAMNRLSYARSATENSARPKVVVGAAENVTSAHISMTANGLTLPHVAWGNGAAGSGAGPAAEVGCASCHNPHGNGQYRILNTTAVAETGTISNVWSVAIRQAYAAPAGAVTGPPAIPAMLGENIYTVISHGLQPGDQITIAGNSNAALNGTFFVKTVGTGAAGQESAGTNNFTISATLGGAAIDITADGTGGTVSRISGVPVTDATLPAAGDARNYTVMQVKSPTSSGTANGPESDYLLYSSQVVAAAGSGTFKGIAGTYTATGGDYFARAVPWNPGVNGVCDPTVFPVQAGCATANSAPNGRPTTFSGQITQWCASCHTRYFANNNPTVTNAPNGATGASWQYPRPNDSLFNHQHRTVAGRDCLTCHVSHGSNAAMTGTFSASFPYPNATTSASSRLLKVDNRGTCQACHDPTGTVAAGTLLPTGAPMPAVP